MCLPRGTASALTGCPVYSGRPVFTFQERWASSLAACSSLYVSFSPSASGTCPPSMSLPTKILSERQCRYCVHHYSKHPFHYLLDKRPKVTWCLCGGVWPTHGHRGTALGRSSQPHPGTHWPDHRGAHWAGVDTAVGSLVGWRLSRKG